MNKKRIIGISILTLILLLVPAVPAFAQGGTDGTTIMNEDYVVEDGETIEGDLVVCNGDVTVEEDGTVEGTLVVWNGDAEVNGSVEEDLVVSGGEITLGEDAYIGGNVVCSWSCDIEDDNGANIHGSIIEGVPMPDIIFGEWPDFPTYIPTHMWSAGPSIAMNLALNLAQNIVTVLIVALLAGLIALIWPDAVAQVDQTIATQPLPSLGWGVLTGIVFVTLIVVLAITICLSPIAFLGAGVLALAALFGWSCIGAMLGERLFVAFKAENIPPFLSAATGTLLISIVAAALGLVPCVKFFSGILVLLTVSLGLGAITMNVVDLTAPASEDDELEDIA